ncbi:hypothetical protein PILCRDRAFT_251586 [Piloderma croceum F 1598]|uniref:Uncharacterized protein n=1 Tax=Piloderma croceum (strain F 1598) TaxID=765440 RepID=A0A0C3CET8_PILCF|nr:hypothetical protein PILCRDRAFT_251586 [Piloderma croceum F 1598]
MSSSPSWPSLYNPALEIDGITGKQPVQIGGHYLYKPEDIFRFTLYWTLIFHIPLFFLCGIYAFLNLTFPPSRHAVKSYSASSASLERPPTPQPRTRLTPPRANEGRSRLTFAIIVLLVFLALSVTNAVIGATVVGFVLAGLYKAAQYNMSTWVPFVWSIIIVLLFAIGVWPSTVDVI